MSPKKSTRGRRSNNVSNSTPAQSAGDNESSSATEVKNDSSKNEENISPSTVSGDQNRAICNDKENIEGATNEGAQEKGKKHDARGVADLERVTDYVEEKEFGAGSQSASGISIYLSIHYLIGVSLKTCLRSPLVDVFKLFERIIIFCMFKLYRIL